MYGEERFRLLLQDRQMMDKRQFNDQVVGGTVKSGRIVLIGMAIGQRQVRVGVTGHQGVDGDLRRNA